MSMFLRQYYFLLIMVIGLSVLNESICVQDANELGKFLVLSSPVSFIEDSGGDAQEESSDLIQQNSIQLEKTNTELSEQLSLLEKDRTSREETITQLKEKTLQQNSPDNQHLSSQYLEKASEQLKRLEQARDQLEHEMQVAVKLAEDAEISGQQLVNVEEKIEKEETKIEGIEHQVQQVEKKFEKELDLLESENKKNEEIKEIDQIAQGFEVLAKTSGNQNDEVEEIIKQNEKNDSESVMEKIDSSSSNDMKSASHLYENPEDLLKVSESDQQKITEQQLINEQQTQQLEPASATQENFENAEIVSSQQSDEENSQQDEDLQNLSLGKEVCSQINIHRIKKEQNELKWDNNLAFLAFLVAANIQTNTSSVNDFLELEIIDEAVKSYDEDGYMAQLVAFVPENNPTLIKLAMDAWEKEQSELLDDDYDYCVGYYKFVFRNNPAKNQEIFGVALLIKSSEVNKQKLEKFAQSDQQFVNFERKVKEDSEYQQMANQFHKPNESN